MVYDGCMKIERLTKATDNVAADLNRLTAQMSARAQPLDRKRLERVVAASGGLWIAVDDERIVGCAQLVVAHQLVDSRGWLEDVVVDEAYRGQGVGRRLVEAALEEARRLGLRSVKLTSGPKREAARALYASFGFEMLETDVWRLDL